MQPQQPDGISNICSRNVRNAGQSDVTERERVERIGTSGKTKKGGDMGKSGTAEESGINTGSYCEHKNTESLFVQGVARYGTNNLFSFSLSAVMTVSGPMCGPRTCTVRAPPRLYSDSNTDLSACPGLQL